MDITQVDPRDPVVRIEKLLDPGSCQLLTENNKCGMVAATGNIAGNKVIVFASDATVKSGALGIDGSKVIVSAYKEAMAAQLPIVGIWHSGGARLK
jgi:acetyl-CoA/propionyl-CoA carboxylase carboxyl transferase subunit